MATVKITIQDTETGKVRVDCEPRPEKLAEMARNRDITAAQGYALAALAKIVKDSQDQLKQEMLDKFNAGKIPAYDRTVH